MKVYIVQYNDGDFNKNIAVFAKHEDAVEYADALEDQGEYPKDTLWVDEWDVQ